MRTKDTLLNDFENIMVLQQYLYMSDTHYITITNSIGVKFVLTMNEDLDYYGKNLNFPDSPPFFWSGEMTNSTILGIIQQLEQAPAVDFPNTFCNRWEEIKTICKSNIALNLD